MRKLMLLLTLVLFWSCDWQPEEVLLDGLSVVEDHIITVGDTVSIELLEHGTNFSPIENPDTSVVEIINHLETALGSQLLLVGKSEGEFEFSFSYEVSDAADESKTARYFVSVRVSESIPLNIHIGEPFELDYSTDLTTEQFTALDSVFILVGQNDPGGSISVENVPGDNTSIILSGEAPGYASLIIETYDSTGSLITSIFYEINVSILKVVLAELYTNTGCVNCPEANHYLDNLLAHYADELAVVRYHVNWTDPFDPMNLYNPSEVEARRAYYNIFAAPGLVLEGTLVTTLDEDDWSSRIFTAANEETSLYISPITVLESLDSLHLEYDIKTFGLGYSDLTSWSLVLEDSIEYMGSNGENIHMQVMRDMSATPITSLNSLQTIQHSLKKPDDYGTGDPMNLLVFIQSEPDKAILQSRKQSLN